MNFVVSAHSDVLGHKVTSWTHGGTAWLNNLGIVQYARDMNLGMDHYNYAYFAGAVETRGEWVITAKVGEQWIELDIPCKVGSVDRAPCVTSPLHRRFAWQL